MENRVRVGSEALAERGVGPAGIVGAVAGAVAAAGLGTANPESWGTAGAVLGSVVVSLGWLAAVRAVGAVSAALRFAPRTEAPAVQPAVPHA